jgi:hypothetical protein
LSEIQLRVGDARQRDVGRGIARIDQQTMQKLGISAGDAVEIVNKRTTSAIAWPAYSEDQNKAIVRIDGFTRKNSDVAINEYVIVRPAKVETARAFTLAPVEMRLNVDEDFTNFVRSRLMERTIVEGDTTLVMMLGHAIPFTVCKTNPTGVVKVTANSKLLILNEPNSKENVPEQESSPWEGAIEALRDISDDQFDKIIPLVMSEYFFDTKQFSSKKIAEETGTTPKIIQATTVFLNTFIINNFSGDLSLNTFQRFLLEQYGYSQSKVTTVKKYFDLNRDELRNSLMFWYVSELNAKLETITKPEYLPAISKQLTELKDLYGSVADSDGFRISAIAGRLTAIEGKVDEIDRLIRTKGNPVKEEEKKRKLW